MCASPADPEPKRATSGVRGSDLSDEVDGAKVARFRSRHPNLHILAESAIKRAIRRRNGEVVEMLLPSNSITARERDLYRQKVTEREDAEIEPALRALEAHGIPPELKELHASLQSVARSS